MSLEGSIDKQIVVYTFGGIYSTTKRNEVQIQATRWMNLTSITVSERIQTQVITFCMIPFTWNIQKGQTHRDRKQSSGFWGWGGGEKGCDYKMMGCCSGVMKKL